MEAKKFVNKWCNMVQKSRLSNQFLFAKLCNTTIVQEKVDFLEIMQ